MPKLDPATLCTPTVARLAAGLASSPLTTKRRSRSLAASPAGPRERSMVDSTLTDTRDPSPWMSKTSSSELALFAVINKFPSRITNVSTTLSAFGVFAVSGIADQSTRKRFQWGGPAWGDRNFKLRFQHYRY